MKIRRGADQWVIVDHKRKARYGPMNRPLSRRIRNILQKGEKQVGAYEIINKYFHPEIGKDYPMYQSFNAWYQATYFPREPVVATLSKRARVRLNRPVRKKIVRVLLRRPQRTDPGPIT